MPDNKNITNIGKVAASIGGLLKKIAHPLANAIGIILAMVGVALVAIFDGDPETVVAVEATAVGLTGAVLNIINFFTKSKSDES